MNRTEHLLTCLIEECAEVQKAVAKALRFGLSDGYPGTDRTNAGDIAHELIDLMAIVDMLQEFEVLPRPLMYTGIATKKAKVLQYMAYAEQKGTLTPNV